MKIWSGVIAVAVVAFILAGPHDAGAASLDASVPGVHRIWGNENAFDEELVRGSFVTIFWRDVNPAPGVFDFSSVESDLQRAQQQGIPVMLNLKGKFKPDFLFTEIPYYPGRLSVGVHDEMGSLQYWHPTHILRYRQLLEAFGNYISRTPYRSSIYSIRGNLNALGTEHAGVDEEFRAENLWIVPPGVRFEAYSDAKNVEYKKFVVNTYYDLFEPTTFVFLRTSLLMGTSGQSMPPGVLQAIRDGRMGLVHTSSVPEPDKGSTETKYKLHIEYGKNGNTPIYAEPYSASDRGPQPPSQWNYWRILGDLHAGVSVVAVYGVDLDQAANPEFRAAYEFANRYAGYQLSSNRARSPGAWVAFREGGNWLTGDYSFLMSRVESGTSEALTNVGATRQRFGAWARRFPAGETVDFQIDSSFAGSLRGDSVTVLVTYLDSRNPRLDVRTQAGSTRISGGNSGLWKTDEVVIDGSQLAGGAGLSIRADSDVTLHMVEVQRSQAGVVVDSVAAPKSPAPVTVQ